MKVSDSKKSVTSLKLTVGPDYVADCGTVVKMRGKTAIKRLSTSKRPAVGRTSSGSTLIKPKKVKFLVRGEKVKAAGRAVSRSTATGIRTALLTPGNGPVPC